MNYSVENYADRNEWLAGRRNSIGASETPAILGESSFSSAYSIWCDKRGLMEPSADENERMLWGSLLEAPIRNQFAERTGRKVNYYGPYSVCRSVKYPFLTASLDGQIEAVEGNGIYEGKCADKFLAAEWGEQPPLKYQIQIQHAMLVTGYRWGSLAVLIGGNEFKYFDVLAHDEFQAAMLDELAKFWECVQSGTPPEIDGSAATTRAIKLLHPDDDGTEVELPEEASGQWARRDLLADKIKSLEEEKAAIDNKFKVWIGSHTFGTCRGDRWTYKTTSRAAYEVKATTYRTLRKAGK